MCSTGHQNNFYSLSVLYNNISFLFLSHLRCIAMPMTHNSHWKKKLIQRTLDKHDCTTQCNIQTWDHHFQNFNGHSDTLQLFLQAICPIRVPLRDATDPIYTGYSSLANGLFSSGWLEFHAKKLLMLALCSVQHRHNCDLKCAPTNPHITSLTLMRMYHMLIEITRRTPLDAKKWISVTIYFAGIL